MPAARHPDVAGAQPVAQFRQHAELVMAPIDGPAAGQDMARPALPDEAGRRGFRQGARPDAVHLAQNLDGAQQRGGGRDALEVEGVQKGRRPTADAGIMLAEGLVGVELLRPRENASASATLARNRSHGITAAIAAKASCWPSCAISAAPTWA